MATFKEALEYSQKNPNSDFANQFRKGIETGEYNDVAKKEGLDVSQFSKPTQTEPVQPQRSFGSDFKDFSVGVAKGVLQTAKGIGSLGQSVLDNTAGRAMNAIEGKGFTNPKTQNLYTKPTKVLDPTNTAEATGKLVEQVGEFFIPSNMVSKSKMAIEATHIPDILKFVSKIAPGVVADVGVAKLQGQSNEELKGAGVASAVTSALPEGLDQLGKTKFGKSVVSYLTEKIPGKMLNSIIKPNDAAFNFSRNPGESVVKEGVTSFTRGGLLTKIGEKKQEVGNLIGEALKKQEVAAKSLDVTGSITGPLEEAKQAALQSGEKTLYNRLLDIEEGLTSIYTTNGKTLEVNGSKLLSNLSPEQVQQLKIKIGKATTWTGQAFDKEANQVRVQIYRNLDDMLDSVVPGIDKLNNRYAGLLTAEKNLEKTDTKMQKFAMIGLKTGGLGATGGIISSMQGDSPLESVLKGAAFAAGGSLIGSTAAKSNAAVALSKLPEAERIALERVAPALKNLLIGANSVENQANSTANYEVGNNAKN